MSYSKFQVSQEFIDNSHVNAQTYENLYKESLENPEKLIKPNLNARLSVVDYINPEAIMVPLRVVRESANGTSYVFVLTQPEANYGYTTEKRIVKLGKSKSELIEVLSGISSGELIVDEGVSTLVADQKVKRILE